jgi:alpha-L-rhamnosidase
MIIDRFKTWENKDGFIDTPPYTYWIDHANIERFGANFSLNALYLLMMKDVMALNSWLGNKEKAAEYELRIETLKNKMQLKFWDEEQKLFRDNILNGNQDGKFTEHSNSLAIVAGIASPVQEKEIVKEFVENKSSRLVHSVIFMHYIVEALFKAGHGEAALALVKDRYMHMNIEGSSTLWEEWGMTVSFRTGKFEPNSSRTVSQAENTFISYSLSNWLLGIHPSQPGLAEITIKPNMGGLQEISGVMPSPKGNIPVKWIKTKKGMTLEIEIPDGMDGLLDMNEIGSKTLLLDGKNMGEPTGNGKYMRIPVGKHKVEIL